jgi:hypothetical protein
MDEHTFRERIAAAVDDIYFQLVQSVKIQEEENEIERSVCDLEKERTKATSGLLEYSAVTNSLAGQRTDMAKERTALVREHPQSYPPSVQSCLASDPLLRIKGRTCRCYAPISLALGQV